MDDSEKCNNDEIIYFIAEEPFTNAVKIGKTNKNVDERLCMLQIGNFRKLNVLLYIKRMKKYDYERFFHKIFYDKRISGEWFSLTLDDINHIKSITDKNDNNDDILNLFNEFCNFNTEIIVGDDGMTMGFPEIGGRKIRSAKHGNMIKPEKIHHEKTKHATEMGIALAPILRYNEFYSLTKNRSRMSNHNVFAIKKYEMLRHYGFEHNIVNSDAKNKRMRSFNNPDFIKLYSKQDVMKSYKIAIYRQLSDETIRQIDDYHTRFMDYEEKTRYNYLLGRHVTINKILSIIPTGGTEYEPVLEIMKQLHEEGNHLLAGWKLPNKLNMINMVNSIIQDYCYKIHSKRTMIGKVRKQILYIEDTLPILFDVHNIKYPSDDFSISMIKQSGESPIPTICVYTE